MSNKPRDLTFINGDLLQFKENLIFIVIISQADLLVLLFGKTKLQNSFFITFSIVYIFCIKFQFTLHRNRSAEPRFARRNSAIPVAIKLKLEDPICQITPCLVLLIKIIKIKEKIICRNYYPGFPILLTPNGLLSVVIGY